MSNAVIYASYSSGHQREESIDRQIRECTDFAKRNGLTVVEDLVCISHPQASFIIPPIIFAPDTNIFASDTPTHSKTGATNIIININLYPYFPQDPWCGWWQGFQDFLLQFFLLLRRVQYICQLLLQLIYLQFGFARCLIR